ncbi:MAG: hypothetical protein HOP17_01430 [Acidobacteria bacterium]|nr:hypothetical protein [Acidobacteriota bacterium]
MTVEILDAESLNRVRKLLGVNDDAEAVKLSIEKTLSAFEPEGTNESHDFDDEDWDALFAQPMIPSSVIDEAIRKERE